MPRTIKFKQDCAHAGGAFTIGDVAAIISVGEAAEAVEKGMADYADTKQAKAKNRAVSSDEIAER